MNRLFIAILYIFPAMVSAQKLDSIDSYHNAFTAISNIEQGDYSDWNQSQKKITHVINLSGWKQLYKSVYAGEISVTNSKTYNTNWLPLDTYYPYLIIDFEPKDIIHESIKINGSYNYLINNKFSSGISVSYQTSQTYNANDPRYELYQYLLNLSPNILFNNSTVEISISPFFRMGSTDLNMYFEKINVNIFMYQHLGLGAIQNPILDDQLLMHYKEQEIGSTQFINKNLTHGRTGLLLSLTRGHLELDRGELNWVTLVNEAQLSSYKIELIPYIKLTTKSNTHSVTMGYNHTYKIGSEYVRNQMTSNEILNVSWKSFGLINKYEETNTQQSLSYSFAREHHHHQMEYAFKLSNNYIKETYHGIEKMYFQKYNIIEPHLAVAYAQQFSKLNITLRGTYSKPILKNYSNDLFENELSTQIYLARKNYLSARPDIFTANCTFGKRVYLFNSFHYFQLVFTGKIWLPENRTSNRTNISAKLKINF